MTMRLAKWNFVASIGVCAALITGCGGETETSGTAASIKKNDQSPTAAESPENAEGLPTAAIGHSATRNSAESPLPEKGSPEWIIGESIHLRAKPLPKTDNQESLKNAKRAKYQKIVDMTTSVIASTHDDPAREKTFNDGVHLLVEARRELALLGDPADIDALYQDAASLYERDKTSKAAAEAAFSVVQFTRTNAQRYAKKDTRWLAEFARQARQYATRFPSYQSRAVSLLDSAGWSCELRGMNDEAISCYTLLKQQFPDSPQANRVPGILRRLNLKGKTIQLGGETLGGQFLKIDHMHGRVVLVAFWSTNTHGIAQQLDLVQDVARKHQKEGFSVLGVNLDEERANVEAFVEEHALKWPQIFAVDPQKRGWQNPVAQAYGIRNIPTYWLVDRNGVVVDTSVQLDTLEQQLAKLLPTAETR